MVTPKLEELILKGRAFFKTFVAGGGQKNTLAFGSDRFIIITDLTYFPMHAPYEAESRSQDNDNTQVSIYSERGFNHYVFRNILSHPGNKNQVLTPITINTYIMHTEAVGFSFSNAPLLAPVFAGVAPTFNPAYQPPLEYGKDGDPGAVSVILNAQTDQGVLPPFYNNYVTRPAGGVSESQQLQFPINSATSFPSASILGNEAYPLMLVNYVEILGLPNNLGI
jgi:hypothetical protein